VTDIATRIREQIAELDAERETLTSALAALDDSTIAATVPERVQRPRTRGRKPARVAVPATKVVPLGKLLRMLSDTDGQTTSALAKATGGDQDRILELLKEAERDEQVRRSGQRRATRWHLVTEESKIAARVAELEAGPDPAAVEKRRAARRKAAANRQVKVDKAAAEAAGRTSTTE